MDQAINLVLGHVSPQAAVILSYLAILIPIVAIVVKLTPSKKDDEMLEKFKELYAKAAQIVASSKEAAAHEDKSE